MSGEYTISSSRAKIARADEHLNTLYRETDAWGASDPFALVRERNTEGSKHLFRLRLQAKPDAWRWALLLGDALHNLRCALDHMVYGLALNNARQDPPDDDAILMFPICFDVGSFRKAEYRIRSLSTPARAAVEKAQPYNRVKPGRWFMPLWWLAQLNNIDKHRLTNLIGSVAAYQDRLSIGAEPGTFIAEWNHGPLLDGTAILRIALSQPDPDVYVNLQCTGAVVIEVEGVPPLGLYHTTRRIRREVVVVCRYLSRFFV